MQSVFDSMLKANDKFNKDYLADIAKSTKFLNDFLDNQRPEFFIILWSGLGWLANESSLANRKTIPYSDIPGFPDFRGVDGHAGELISATLQWTQVMMMSGRYHFYEYADLPPAMAMKLITFPVRVAQALDIPNMIVSNAAGGVNRDFKVGDVMLMKSHINMMWSNPLLGPNIEELWVRFSPMTDAYDPRMLYLAKQYSANIKEWIYCALTGPTYETPAEYGMVYRLGADTVGMSTAPEVIAARHANFDIKGADDIDYHNTNRMNVLGLSVVTNLGWPEFEQSPSHEEVKQAANVAMPKVIKIVKWVIKNNSPYLCSWDIDILIKNFKPFTKEYILLSFLRDVLFNRKQYKILYSDVVVNDWKILFKWVNIFTLISLNKDTTSRDSGEIYNRISNLFSRVS